MTTSRCATGVKRIRPKSLLPSFRIEASFQPMGAWTNPAVGRAFPVLNQALSAAATAIAADLITATADILQKRAEHLRKAIETLPS